MLILIKNMLGRRTELKTLLFASLRMALFPLWNYYIHRLLMWSKMFFIKGMSNSAEDFEEIESLQNAFAPRYERFFTLLVYKIYKRIRIFYKH